MKNKLIALLAIGAGLAMSRMSADAQFTYNANDILLGFRSTTLSYDYVVDLGSASQFYNATPGTTFTVSGYDAASLTAIFGSLDSLSFSIFGDVRTFGNTNGTFNTLWISSARSDINTQTSPWYQSSVSSQGTVAAQIDGIAGGAVSFGGAAGADAVTNSLTAVTVPDTFNAIGIGISYTIGIGTVGNFANTFQGSAENTTPLNFATSGSPLRSDFYQLNPGTGDSIYLGYFELSPNGTMTFTAVPEPSTLAMLGAGMLLFLGVNRFRHQKKI